MKIPPELNINQCNKCKAVLQDSAFNRFGFSIVTHQHFFEYKCPCGHTACYVLQASKSLSPPEALLKLAQTLIECEQEQASDSKGNIKDVLNKITGVEDLLKLGGNNAPRE